MKPEQETAYAEHVAHFLDILTKPTKAAEQVAAMAEEPIPSSTNATARSRKACATRHGNRGEGSMSDVLFELEIEEIINEWEAGEMGLSEAIHDLMRLFWDHDPSDAQEYLRAANPDLYDEQEEAEGVTRMEKVAEVTA